MSQDTTQPLTRRLAWWMRRIAGPSIDDLRTQLAKANAECNTLRTRLHREVTEHNRTLQKINDLEAKVSVLLDERTPEERPLCPACSFPSVSLGRAKVNLETGEVIPL